MDVIVIGGSPGNGKTTIGSDLHKKYESPWFEFGWIPEFTMLNPHTRIGMKEEEQMTFENLVLVVKNYLKHGFENIILTDLNDMRMLDIPECFSEYNYVIFTLYSENDNVIKDRILNRDNGNEYKNYEKSIVTNRKIKARKLLPNEYKIRSDNATPSEIIDEISRLLLAHKKDSDFNLSDYNREDFSTYITE
ncbi:MAG: hypothetical protein K0S47_2210 [Herbinix sp.]|jgi:broad-specificity NMP kinase|nr:hypothetical protein [Herbinix sp.]